MKRSHWVLLAFVVVATIAVGCNKADVASNDSIPPEYGTGGGAGGMYGGPGGGEMASGGAPSQEELSPIPIEDGIAELDGENTNILFTGTKPDGTRHSGGFAELSGKIAVEGDAIKSISVEIQTSSIWSDAGRLTDHLKSPDFFNVNEHPTATFSLTSIDAVEGGKQTVSGELTMLGKTDSVSFPASVTISDGSLQLQGEFKLDRTKFGMTYGEGQVDSDVEMVINVGKGSAATGMEGGGGEGQTRGPGGGGRRGGGGGGGFDPAAIFAERDADGDGKLAGDEISDRMKDRVADIDTDGDGAVSLEEFQAMMQAFRGGGGGGGGRRGGGGPGGGSERPQRPERPESE